MDQSIHHWFDVGIGGNCMGKFSAQPQGPVQRTYSYRHRTDYPHIGKLPLEG